MTSIVLITVTTYKNCSVCRTVANALADVTDDRARPMSAEALRINLVIVSLFGWGRFDSNIRMLPEGIMLVVVTVPVSWEANLWFCLMTEMLACIVADDTRDRLAGADANI